MTASEKTVDDEKLDPEGEAVFLVGTKSQQGWELSEHNSSSSIPSESMVMGRIPPATYFFIRCTGDGR